MREKLQSICCKQWHHQLKLWLTLLLWAMQNFTKVILTRSNVYRPTHSYHPQRNSMTDERTVYVRHLIRLGNFFLFDVYKTTEFSSSWMIALLTWHREVSQFVTELLPDSLCTSSLLYRACKLYLAAITLHECKTYSRDHWTSSVRERFVTFVLR